MIFGAGSYITGSENIGRGYAGVARDKKVKDLMKYYKALFLMLSTARAD